jgi:hypothetical protein
MRWRGNGVRGARFWVTAIAMPLAGFSLLAGCTGGPARTSARPVSATVSGASVHTPAVPAPPATAAPPTARADGPPLLPAPPPPPAPTALPVAPGAGSLGQTREFPGTTTVAFRNAMDDLWLAVTTGNPRFALPAFFPETAYVQVKAIADPESDWQHRLWYDFTLDVAAAHDLVGKNAKLVRVIVPAGYAAWVYPGDCYNSIGYWHVPGARVVYREGSQLLSFGIASLISWRGDWYVVHFGAVLRDGDYGVVDAPADGPGDPGPPGGC